MTLSFKLGNIPVRVEPSFWFLSVFLASGGANPANVLVLVAVIFVSILLHELGHALVGKSFGLSPVISLHGMGGTTSWEHRRVSRARSVFISLAGPLAGLAAGSSVYLLVTRTRAFDSAPALAATAAAYFVWINATWGVFNLLPMLPLDGGNVMRQFVREPTARGVSILVALIAGVALMLRGYASWWTAIMIGLIIWQNVRALRENSSRAGSQNG